MALTWDERPNSGRMTSAQPGMEFEYGLYGETDRGVAWSYALGATPSFVLTPLGILYRQDVTLAPDGYARFIVTVPYAQQQRSTGSATFDFDTTGATIHITASKEHIRTYPVNMDLHKGSIGVTKDGSVDGADIIIPALRLNYRFRHPQGVVTESHAVNLARATGKTNANTFRGFAGGELLFAGATGSDGTDAEAEVGYSLIASENAAALTIGDIVGIAKEGHHLLWVEYEDTVDAGKPATKPQRVHIERCYESVDFAGVFGWS